MKILNFNGYSFLSYKLILTKTDFQKMSQFFRWIFLNNKKSYENVDLLTTLTIFNLLPENINDVSSLTGQSKYSS